MITPNAFPNGDAGGVRDFYFTKMYQEIGYNVVYISSNYGIKECRCCGIDVFKIGFKSKNKLLRAFSRLFYSVFLSKLVTRIFREHGRPSIIHLYSVPHVCFRWAIKENKKSGALLIHDSVEWYSPCEFKLGVLSREYVLNNLLNTKIVKKPFSVICISSFLERFFSEKGLKTIRIPVVMDYNDFGNALQITSDKKIRIVYAGSPGSKDCLDRCLIAFDRLNELEKNILSFDVYGVDERYIRKTLKQETHKSIFAHGRVSRDTVLIALHESDFAILIRPSNERYSMAGFPTKSVEAMMCGNALICNYTSDLKLYLEDNENAIIVSSYTVDDIQKAFMRVAKMTRDNVNRIKHNALLTAKSNFDYRFFVTSFKKFVGC